MPEPGKVETPFVPSAHGFAFPNTWRDTVFGAIASRGRCGGMVFAALDHFRAGEPPPHAEDGRLPEYDSGLARYIWRRQIASAANGLGINLWRFVLLTYLPSRSPFGAADVARREIVPLLDALSAGRPVPLGLVSSFSPTRLFNNHQVLAVGAEVDETRVLVRIYDPNFPLRNDVVLEVPLEQAAPVIERAGSREIAWRGFFVEHYVPVRVVSRESGPLIDRAASTRPYWVAGAIVLVAAWLIRLLLRRSFAQKTEVIR